jgi:hypothetical protein
MKESNIRDKLDKVLKNLGMDTKAWSTIVSSFGDKLLLLDRSSIYRRLLKSLFSSRDLDGFNSYAFEAQFAYDFEINGQPLLYETRPIGKNLSTVDFCRELNPEYRIYFELRLIQQRNWITKWIASQIKSRKYYQIELTGIDEKDETIRLQNLILSKCQDESGNPIKFTVSNNYANMIVVNVSDLHLGMIDRYDCILTMYGDNAVPFYCRVGIFGLWQKIDANATDEHRELYLKFKHLRETIHGILFVRHVKDSGYLDKIFIDRDLEYLIVFNNNLIQESEGKSVCEKLSFLRHWTEKENENGV